jgi:hypothetical protein
MRHIWLDSNDDGDRCPNGNMMGKNIVIMKHARSKFISMRHTTHTHKNKKNKQTKKNTQVTQDSSV